MLILGLETSCDETGVALYDTEKGLRAHALHTQAALHAAYGGVVPELASRDHIRRVLPLTRQVLDEAGCALADITAIGYTAGPGLAGALLVGAGVAQGLAFALGIPAVGIHHLEGHLLSPLMPLKGEPAPEFPFLALLVSGGHTQLMRVAGIGQYELLGETRDDAAGEAFDKSAQLLGLGYPGGPAIAALAQQGRAGRYTLPRPMLAGMAKSGNLDFSFSGLKTAVLLHVRDAGGVEAMDAQARADLAAELESAIVDTLCAKTLAAMAATALKSMVIAGGVAANRTLRARLDAAAAQKGYAVYYPAPELCTDNGAMIAFAAALRLQQMGLPAASAPFAVRARWPLDELAS